MLTVCLHRQPAQAGAEEVARQSAREQVVAETGLASNSLELNHLLSSGQLDALLERLSQLPSGPDLPPAEAAAAAEQRARLIAEAVAVAREGAAKAAEEAQLLAEDKSAATALRLQLLKVAEAASGEVITAREAAAKAAAALKTVSERARGLLLGMLDDAAKAALGLAARTLLRSVWS